MSQVRHNMTNHPLNYYAVTGVESLREQFISLGERLEVVCPESRERSLALTSLEQALMWAVASIARNQ